MSKESDRMAAAAEAYKQGMSVGDILELTRRVNLLETIIEQQEKFLLDKISEQADDIKALHNTVDLMKRNRSILGG